MYIITFSVFIVRFAVKDPFRRKTLQEKKGGVRMPMAPHARLGCRGEQLTVRFLRRKGYKIITVNFATSAGETDIVARAKDGTLCFVEVKTRAEGGMFPPAEAVDAEKQKRLISNAYRFLSAMHEDADSVKRRFDIAEVTARSIFDAEINYIKDAFTE